MELKLVVQAILSCEYSRVSITRTATENENLFELKRHSKNRDSFKRASELKGHQNLFEIRRRSSYRDSSYGDSATRVLLRFYFSLFG